MTWLITLPLLALAIGLPLAHHVMRPRSRRTPSPSNPVGRTRVVMNHARGFEYVERGLHR